jgi:hypothetical protein
MTWIAVENALEVHRASDQWRLRLCADCYSNCEHIHRPAMTYTCYIELAHFI